MGELGLPELQVKGRTFDRATNKLFAKNKFARDAGEDGVELMEMDPKKNAKDRTTRLKQMQKSNFHAQQHVRPPTNREEMDSDWEPEEVCNPLFSSRKAKHLENPLYKNKKLSFHRKK